MKNLLPYWRNTVLSLQICDSLWIHVNAPLSDTVFFFKRIVEMYADLVLLIIKHANTCSVLCSLRACSHARKRAFKNRWEGNMLSICPLHSNNFSDIFCQGQLGNVKHSLHVHLAQRSLFISEVWPWLQAAYTHAQLSPLWSFLSFFWFSMLTPSLKPRSHFEPWIDL